MGKDEPEARPTSALEQAKAGREDSGMFAGAVTGLIESLLDVGIDGKGPFDSAQKVADVKRAEKPDAEEAVDAVVRGHLKLAAAGGFVTGLGGFITLPVALPANVVEFYVVATRMVGSIASLRGYDIKQPEIRSAVLLTLVGADADDLLKKAGVASTGRLANLAAQRLPGPAMMVVNKAVGFRLLSTAGKKTLTRFGKGVPGHRWCGRCRSRQLPAQEDRRPRPSRVPPQGDWVLTGSHLPEPRGNQRGLRVV